MHTFPGGYCADHTTRFQRLPPCGCERAGSTFCNHVDGLGVGSCELCSHHSTWSSCYNDSLPLNGVVDCLNWCFGIEQVDDSMLSGFD